MVSSLSAIPGVQVSDNVLLSRYTRFALGGPARLLADASSQEALASLMQAVQGCPWTLIGSGSNLIAGDAGFPGVVVRYTAKRIEIDDLSVWAEAGAALQDLVDATIAAGLQGLETMTGIPGWVGGAVYGNAGAYGHSIEKRVEAVRFFDGGRVREISAVECNFRYRESIFKQHKDWVVLGTRLKMERAAPAELRTTAEAILKIRNEKYPPTLRCAGSIFKNLLVKDLPKSVRTLVPPTVIREGKVPSAYFLEQVGAKGMCVGGIRVADYHANLLFNAGPGTAAEARELIGMLKSRVRERYGLELEEEVQYL
jgi:UDP-N-acetylmuramate dehydrogenase